MDCNKIIIPLVLVLILSSCQPIPTQVGQVPATIAATSAPAVVATATAAPPNTPALSPTPTSTPAHTPTPAPSPTPPAADKLLAMNQEVMSALKTSHIEMLVTIAVGEQSMEMVLDGLIESPQKSYFDLETGGQTIEVLTLDAEHAYTRLPGSDVWTRADTTDAGVNYQPQLTPLEVAKSAVVEREETLDGVDTYVVSYQIDIASFLEAVPSFAQLVEPLQSTGEGKTWIGKDDFLTRKFEMNMTMNVAGQKFSYAYEGTVSDFDQPVLIPEPKPYYSQTVLETSDPVIELAFSPDGRLLAVCDDDQLIYLWSTADLDADPQLIKHPTHPDMKTEQYVLGVDYYSLAFSPDGKTLAAGTDGQVLLYSLADLTAEPVKLEPAGAAAGGGDVDAVAWSPDGMYLAGAGTDQVIYVWSAGAPDAAPKELSAHDSPVVELAFTPDGEQLIAGSEDGTILIWSTADLAAPQASLTEHKDDFHALEVTPDGRYMLSVGFNDPVYAWSLAQPANRPETLIPRTDEQTGKLPTLDLAISADGETVATADTGGVVRLWSLASPESAFGVLSTQSQYDLMALDYSADGKHLAAGSGDARVYVWDLSPEP